MKNIFFTLVSASVFLLAGCDKDENNAPLPSAISNVTVEPRVGGAMVRWSVPADSNYFYVQTRYMKDYVEKKRTIATTSSVYTDSVLVTGLRAEQEYEFELQAFNSDIVGGETIKTGKVRPIARPIKVTYSVDEAVKVALTADILDTYTQETSEGPKANLVDGNISTYWHSAWSGGVAPLPHWIQINFDQPTKLGMMKYFFRQSTNANGRPNKWDVQTYDEESGEWKTQWESAANLATTEQAKEQVLNFGKNIEGKKFRMRILATNGNTTYAHLGEFSVFTLGESLTDTEAEFVKNDR